MALDWHGDEITRTVKARAAIASQQIAELILKRAQETCPIDTGELRASGHIRVGGDAFDADDSETYRTVVFDANHSVYVHDGTASMIGRPFLAQAVLFTQADARRIIAATVFGK